MKLAGKITLHLCLIALMVALPLALSSWADRTGGSRDAFDLFMLGCMACPLYLSYWAYRIEHDFWRIVTRDVLLFTLITLFLLATWDFILRPVLNLIDPHGDGNPFLPLVTFALLPSFVMAIYRFARGPSRYGKAHCLAFLLSLLLGLSIAIFLFIAAMSAMPKHY